MNQFSSLDIVNEFCVATNKIMFLPARINEMFPTLKKFMMIKSGLVHLERDDMRQFGDGLTSANFDGNLLTAIEDDLFEYNPNLEYIGLHNNPLKYINPAIFRNFQKKSKLAWVQIDNSNCINQTSTHLSMEAWNHRKCVDAIAESRNIETIFNRMDFFLLEVFPENYSSNKVVQSLQIKRSQDELKIRKLQQKVEKMEKELALLKEKIDTFTDLLM